MTFDELVRAALAGEHIAIYDPELLGRRAFAYFAEFGTEPNWGDPTSAEISRFFGEARQWIAATVGDTRASVAYLDTTTLYTARMLLRTGARDVATAETLMDLATFVNAVALHDHVIHLERTFVDTRDFNEALGNQPVFLSLPLETLDLEGKATGLHGPGVLLCSLCGTVKEHIRELGSAVRDGPSRALFADLEEVQKGWTGLLGEQVSFDDLFNYQGLQGWYSYGPGLLQQLVDVIRDAETSLAFEDEDPAGIRRRFIVESNERSLFNSALAYSLQLPYLPNVARMPFRRFSHRRGIQTQTHLLALRHINREYRDLAEAWFAPQTSNVALPFLLSGLLHRIGSLSEFFEALAELRKQAAPFRRHRAEMDDAIRRGDVKTAQRIRRAVEQGAEGLREGFAVVPVLAAIIALLPGLAGASPLPGVILTTLSALTLISRFGREDIEKLWRRAFQPQYWFLTDLTAAASAMTNAVPKIAQLWGLSDPSVLHLQRRLACLKALEYA